MSGLYYFMPGDDVTIKVDALDGGNADPPSWLPSAQR
jgi:hypothetical protein